MLFFIYLTYLEDVHNTSLDWYLLVRVRSDGICGLLIKQWHWNTLYISNEQERIQEWGAEILTHPNLAYHLKPPPHLRHTKNPVTASVTVPVFIPIRVGGLVLSVGGRVCK